MGIDYSWAKKIKRRSIRGKVYRFHKARHFYRDPKEFYKNFIDTPKGFYAQGRFAMASAHCGHYFARSREVATAEAFFYFGVSDERANVSCDVRETLDMLASGDDERVFLEIDLKVDSLADFTHGPNIEAFLRHGTAQWNGRERDDLSYLVNLVSFEAGGNNLTNILGADAKAANFSGVIFPSVRALMFDGPEIDGVEYRHKVDKDHPFGFYAGEMGSSQQNALYQLMHDWNAVIFSGALLTQSISRITWTDRRGETGSIENPFYGCDETIVELARLRERAHLKLNAKRAAIAGLLTSEEMEDEFEDETFFWIPIEP